MPKKIVKDGTKCFGLSPSSVSLLGSCCLGSSCKEDKPSVVNNIAINNLTTNNALFMVALFTANEGLSLKCLVPPWNQTFNILTIVHVRINEQHNAFLLSPDEESHMDVHDRALLYYRLLKTNPKEVIRQSCLFIFKKGTIY